MDIEDTLLMIPGPVKVAPRVLRAMSKPMISHRSGEFGAIYSECAELLKEFFQTKNQIAIMTGSGTLGMDAAVAGIIGHEDKIVTISNGKFGERFTEIGERYGKCVPVKFDWGMPFDLDRVEAALEEGAKAVAMVNEKKVRAIMKGNVHSDELLAQVVKREGGLRGKRRISHVFVLDVPTLNEPLFISDAAINIAPDLTTKVDIVQNAIDLARACGLEQPRVAILSAVETVNVNIPSSMDAAILAKMADRGQITGGIVDGPLAMDNAIDLMAAQTKHLESPVAGRAQVLIVPNLEAGNMLAKQLTFVSHAQPAGLVLGARVPVMLTSRADNERARLFSCALALLYDAFKSGKKA